MVRSMYSGHESVTDEEGGVTFFGGTWRAEERGKRPGIVGRMEKLGRRRKLEIRKGFNHHLSTSNVQQPHQANRYPTEADQDADPKCHFGFCGIKSVTWDSPDPAWVGNGFIWCGTSRSFA